MKTNNIRFKEELVLQFVQYTLQVLESQNQVCYVVYLKLIPSKLLQLLSAKQPTTIIITTIPIIIMISIAIIQGSLKVIKRVEPYRLNTPIFSKNYKKNQANFIKKSILTRLVPNQEKQCSIRMLVALHTHYQKHLASNLGLLPSNIIKFYENGPNSPSCPPHEVRTTIASCLILSS